MTEYIVETHRLRKQFGATTAVADLSLNVVQGEVFGFLGPNGAGKTTSMKLLLGLAEPSGGSGSVLGKPLGDRGARVHIGFLPEHSRFHECLSGRDLLRVHGWLHGLRGRLLEARIDELTARVDLADAEHRPLREYSKGMQQRIGLAQALIGDPRIVFLDEPTSGLDPLGRLMVRDVIEELRERGVTVFLNSHLLGEVEATCDRVVFVKQGRTVHELSLRNAAQRLDIELRVGRSDAPLLAALNACGTDVRAVGAGVIHLNVESESALPQIASLVVAQGAQLYELKSRRKSLEDWFVEVVGNDHGPG